MFDSIGVNTTNANESGNVHYNIATCNLNNRACNQIYRQTPTTSIQIKYYNQWSLDISVEIHLMIVQFE